jgi:hypothetical protein
LCTLNMRIMNPVSTYIAPDGWVGKEANLCSEHAWFKGYMPEQLPDILLVVHRTYSCYKRLLCSHCMAIIYSRRAWKWRNSENSMSHCLTKSISMSMQINMYTFYN